MVTLAVYGVFAPTGIIVIPTPLTTVLWILALAATARILANEPQRQARRATATLKHGGSAAGRAGRVPGQRPGTLRTR